MKRDCGTAVSLSENTPLLLLYRCERHPQPVRLFRERIHSADSTRYFGVTVATHFTWPSHINLVWKMANQTMVLLGPPFIRSYLYIANCFLLTSRSFVLWRFVLVPSWVLAPGPSLEPSSVFALRLKPLGSAGNKQIHKNLDVSFFAEKSEHQPSGFE
jgi:hypothetical protein